MHGLRRLRGAVPGSSNQSGVTPGAAIASPGEAASYLMLPMKRFSTSAGASTWATWQLVHT